MRYLTVGDIEAMNMRFVGPDGLADFALLDSAVMRPQQSVMGATHTRISTIKRRRCCIRWREITRSSTATAQGQMDVPAIAGVLKNHAREEFLPEG